MSSEMAAYQVHICARPTLARMLQILEDKINRNTKVLWVIFWRQTNDAGNKDLA